MEVYCLLMLRFSGMNCPSSTTSLTLLETWMDPTHRSTSSLSLSLREQHMLCQGWDSQHPVSRYTQSRHSADAAPRADLTSWGPGGIDAAPEPPPRDTMRGQTRSPLSLRHQFLVFPKGLWENKDLCPNVRRMRRKVSSPLRNAAGVAVAQAGAQQRPLLLPRWLFCPFKG